MHRKISKILMILNLCLSFIYLWKLLSYQHFCDFYSMAAEKHILDLCCHLGPMAMLAWGQYRGKLPW